MHIEDANLNFLLIVICSFNPNMSVVRASLALVCVIIFGGLPIGQAAESTVNLEGTLEFVRPVSDQQLELTVTTGTNQVLLTVDNCAGKSPTLFSRIRVSTAVSTNDFRGDGRLVISNLDQITALTGGINLFARNVSELRRMGEAAQHLSGVAYLKGTVLAASEDGRTFAFQDDTGVELLQIATSGRHLEPGQEILVAGNFLVEGDGVLFCDPPIVSNNDVHGMTERTGTADLKAGRHPFRLDWFNNAYPYGLEVYYQGSGLPRQRIPDTALFRPSPDPAKNDHALVNGVDYRCYEGGSWLRVPDFRRLTPNKQGTAANFDLTVITRTNDVGLEFTGFVEVPWDGIYTFSTISDDGSMLYIDERPPFIEVTGTNSLRPPTPITVRQSLNPGEDDRWAQAEGTVTFASARAGGLELELSSDIDKMQVVVVDGSGVSPQSLLNSRARITGICLSARTSSGQSVAGTLLVPGSGQIELLSSPAQPWSGQPATNLPVLTSVEQIKRLTREEWHRGYPVKIHGVITTVFDNGFFIRDATRSIYARWWPPTDYAAPKIGDYWEIEGTTFAEFAPNIRVSQTTRLGTGTLPEPLRPTWDQLINGSLDTEYVEVRGIITAVAGGEMTLLTGAGNVRLGMPDRQPQELPQYLNSLVRVRGCVMPVRENGVQRVVPGQINLCNASITVDEPAPADPFSIRLKNASDLLAFDASADVLQRVKVSGQILYERNGQWYLMDGADGLRVLPKTSADLRVGDLVEVVGFPYLGGPSPVFHEALARRIGRADLPKPTSLSSGTLLDRHNDATLVRLEAKLTTASRNESEQVLALEAGTHGFVARLKLSDGLLPTLQPGSLLELTGIYAGQDNGLASGRDISSFELLVNSPGDVKVLARPSWWTVRHTLTALGGMAFAMLVALVWIALLRRQVEERSNQLASEIRRHEQTERQRELESERSRIARDLHDDLGASLTQIRFLSAVESRDSLLPEATRVRLKQVTEKSHEMVASLDEIVWAVNPANDSLPSVANYLCHFAGEFFDPTAIRCRLDVADDLPPTPLTSEIRHNLFLSVREALNNVAKHSQATEVWLRMEFKPPGSLRLSVEDNGRGFPSASEVLMGNGVGNIRQRLEQIGGKVEYESRPGGGTICRMDMPLPPCPAAASPGQPEA